MYKFTILLDMEQVNINEKTEVGYFDEHESTLSSDNEFNIAVGISEKESSKVLATDFSEYGQI